MTRFSHPQHVLEFIAASRGDIALVVVTDISGGTLRAKGALMAVTADDTAGYISAGCVDGDIIYQAREALTDGNPRALVYGAGSPFKDIALPCGGTIKITIFPNPDRDVFQSAVAKLKNRQSATLKLAGLSLDYHPPLRLRIAGRGAPFMALAQLAQASGICVIGQSPDEDLAGSLFERFDHLASPAEKTEGVDDKWTAVVVLFHDHEWEPHILTQALSGEAFYIGAMGSARTHAMRLETLKSMGGENTDRIKGPIGLIPAMRDAQLLAVSILADIIHDAQQKNRL